MITTRYATIIFFVTKHNDLCVKLRYLLNNGYCVVEPPKVSGPHALVLVLKTSDGYACAPDNLSGSVQLPQGHRINHLQPEPRD
jgi:hypothetical protein